MFRRSLPWGLMRLRHRITNNYRAGGDPDSDLQCGGRWHRLERSHDVQGGSNRPTGVVFVRLGPSEIDHQAIAQILGNVTPITFYCFATDFLICLKNAA